MLPLEEGRFKGSKGGDKGLIRGGGGQQEKMGVFVDESNRIVLQNWPCPQINVQLVALFSVLVPFGKG